MKLKLIIASAIAGILTVLGVLTASGIRRARKRRAQKCVKC